jgi:hypothetical protein
MKRPSTIRPCGESNVILIWPKPGFIGQRENRGEEVKMKNPSTSQRNWKF